MLYIFYEYNSYYSLYYMKFFLLYIKTYINGIYKKKILKYISILI